MPKKVHKYPLIVAGKNNLMMPEGARIVHVEEQKGVVTIWAEHEVTGLTTSEFRMFQVYGTGHEIPDSAIHRGTLCIDPFVWHVYELRE